MRKFRILLAVFVAVASCQNTAYDYVIAGAGTAGLVGLSSTR